MAYFANGSESDAYTAGYRDRCQHNDDGCVIMDLHMLWNYSQSDNEDQRLVLGTFIPVGENGWPMQCVMSDSYPHLRAHETSLLLVCLLLLEKKK